MQIQITNKGKYVIITLIHSFDEDIDVEYFDSYLKTVIEKGSHFIAIKFSENSHLYSGAISILIRYKKTLREKNGNICILNANESISKAFKILHLDREFKLYTRLEDLP
ncbi:MAG: STAS domain-containing protein [bacterium]